MNDIAYQLMEERQVSFEDFCKQQYEDAFALMDDDGWPDYKEWVSDHYETLEKEWKDEN